MRKIFATAVLATLSFNANAALVAGANGTVLDEATGLSWATWDTAAGLSYTEAGTIEGYRYATSAEVFTLFQNALPSFSGNRTGNNVPNAVQNFDSTDPVASEANIWWDLFGGGVDESGFDPAIKSAWFFLHSSGDVRALTVNQISNFIPGEGAVWLGDGQIISPFADFDDSIFLDRGFPQYSTFLVAAVPVPAAVWLFGSALLGLGWLRRKQIA